MIRLIYNYYEDKNPARKAEIDLCLQKNLENKFINTVIIETDTKPTYGFFLNKINELTGPNDINLFCNADIFFDETIVLAETHLKHKQAFALSRWDWINENKIQHFDRPDSQDTWIIKGIAENISANFLLGTPGSDNKMAYEFNKAGYAVSNPSKSIKSYHVHNSNIRNYTRKDSVPPPYLMVPPSSL